MRDLLNGFGTKGCSDDSAEEDSGEIELSLGLSLGGSFGVDPKRKGLVRSSSIPVIPIIGNGEAETEREVLVRTCSLPVETEEEMRKRKSMQTMRRMEAKKRRMEKKGGSGGSRCSGKGREDGDLGWEKCEVEGKGQLGMGSGVFGFFGGRGVEEDGVGRMASQRSVGSQGSCSSAGGVGRPDFVAQIEGCAGSKPAPDIDRNHSIPQTMMLHRASSAFPNETKKTEKERTNGQVGRTNSMTDSMPFVSTKGEGPNARVIEGFLYKYNKGEEVKIVCVCHGRFFTPAEFVKHGGGGDVPHPLRHIVVKPYPFAFL